MRKSGRQRIPSRKVAENVDLPPEILAEDELDEGERPLDEIVDEEDSDFPVDLASNERDMQTDISDSGAESENDLSNSTDAEEPEEASLQAFSDLDVINYLGSPKKNRSVDKASQNRRGPLPNRNEIHVSNFAELDQAERSTLEKTRRQWQTDSCLPTRKRMRLPFAYENEQLEREAREGWDWYFDQGGKENFFEQQEVLVLSPEGGRGYVSGVSQDLLVGPYGRQKLVNLHHLQSLPLDAIDQDTATSVLEPDTQPFRKEKRHGWILNIGRRLQCFDWAPNHEDIQYLALASSQKSRPSIRDLSKDAPAFIPAPSTPSAIQIWSFCTSRPSNSPIDESPPKLDQVLCCDWGSITQLKWCPMPCSHRQFSDPAIFIGLLAIVSGDGYARVIALDSTSNDFTTYLKIATTFFASRSPESITTTLAWLSPTYVAIAHSDGSISVHDISISSHPSSSEQAPTAHTIFPPYIPSPALTLAQAYPNNPTLLATSAIAGHTRLFDLRAPNTDYTIMPRARFPATNLIYSPHLASFLHNNETDGTLRATSVGSWDAKGASIRLRKTGTQSSASSNNGARKKAGDEVMEIGMGPLGKGCLDAGKVHTCIAWGGADGRVMVCNPLMSVLGSKRRKRDNWLVCVCRLEWVRRRPRQTEMSANAGSSDEQRQTEMSATGDSSDERRDTDERMGEPGDREKDGDLSEERRGISRITQSYKAENPEYGPERREKVKQVTIFEEENAVTAVSWNPNLSCGGWLAVGWGNGLLRIEDVAI